MPADVEKLTVDHEPKRYSGTEKGLAYTQSKLSVEKMAREKSEQTNTQFFLARFFWINVDDQPVGRWMDQFRCSHEDTVTFLQKCVDAQVDQRYVKFFVGSIYGNADVFDFKEGKLIGFEPTHYQLESQKRPSL